MKKVTAMLFSMAVGLMPFRWRQKRKRPRSRKLITVDWRRHYERHVGDLFTRAEPEWSMTMVERLEGVAQESSTAGTTPEPGILH